MNEDGAVVIGVDLDISKADKELVKLKKDIDKLEQTISEKEGKKTPLVQQAEELNQQIKEATAEAEKFGQQWAAGVAGADKEQSAALEKVRQLKEEYGKVTEKIDKVDSTLMPSYEKLDGMKEKAGELAKEITEASKNTSGLTVDLSGAEKAMDKFTKRLTTIAKKVFVFSLITTALRAMRTYMSKVIKTNAQATQAIARLKGALLTLAQPIINVIIPAFTALVNIITVVVNAFASVISFLFGTTRDESAKAASSLYDETAALDATGDAAKKASKSLASFDEINKLTSDDSSDSASSSSSGITPDFGTTDDSWLKDVLGKAAGWVTAALILGGIALIAIGACTGSLLLVVTGISTLVTGFYVGKETGVLDDWVKKLGLESVMQFISVALILGGIALIAIGAMLVNIACVLAGLGLLAAGVAVAVTSGTLDTWANKLGLDSITDYVGVAIQLAGIALVAIGAAMGNIFMVIAGGVLLAAGIAVQALGEQKLTEWWEKLKLTQVTDWIRVITQLVGICLIAIGAALGNILMIVAGMGLMALGTVDTGEKDLRDWVTVLGLTKVAHYATIAVTLAGIALVAIGAATFNIVMIIGGLALFYAGLTLGEESGTFRDWWVALGLPQVPSWVQKATLLGGMALVAIGAATLNIVLVVVGLALLGVSAFAGTASDISSQGVAVGNDLTDGVTEGLLENTAKATKKYGDSLVEGTRDALETHSPSKAFQSIGEDLADGMKVGVESKTGETVSAFSDMLGEIKTDCSENVTEMQKVHEEFITYLVETFLVSWKDTWNKCNSAAKTNIQAVIQQIDALNAKLASIERNIVIRITTIQSTISGESSSSSSTSSVSSGTTSSRLRSASLSSVPALATGAVIPPNRAFMAMLGDQKTGNNLEAPESLLRRIVREESGNQGSQTVVIEIDKREFGKFVRKYGDQESNRIGSSLVGV